jgi:TPR repeat protein
MKRVEANDAACIFLLANYYHNGRNGFQEDHVKAIELYARAADLGFSEAHSHLGHMYYDGGDLKKAKLHLEAAAMVGHEVARCNLGSMELESGNMERAIKHWTIAASAGEYKAMHNLQGLCIEKGWISGESIGSILIAYNNSCAEMRSEARDAYIDTQL